MDKKIANNIIVGFMVLAAFGGFIFVLFNIGGGGALRSKEVLYGRFSHVKGLFLGSEVSLSGFRVGVVKSIFVDADTSKGLVVEFTVISDVFAKLHEDAQATIKTQGVLGDKYIDLQLGSMDAPPLKPGTFIKTYEPTDLFQKSGNLVEGIAKKFDKGGDADLLLQNLNQLTINLTQLSNQLKTGKGLYHELADGKSAGHLNNSLQSLSSILKKIDNGEGTLGALVNDPSVYEDLKTILGGAKRSSVMQYFMRNFSESGEKAKKK